MYYKLEKHDTCKWMSAAYFRGSAMLRKQVHLPPHRRSSNRAAWFFGLVNGLVPPVHWVGSAV